MKQEYLIVNKNELASLKEQNFDNIMFSFLELPITNKWVVCYETSSNNETDAINLSKINEFVCNNSQCHVLTNESSAYFNKSLFPKINLFEWKLRKLLYLASATQDDNTVSSNIDQLERKDLGTIFELLFTDSNYIKKVKTKINDKSWQFTKEEINLVLSNIEENTLWDKLLGDNAVPTLRNNFITIKNYRNDVMHAHSMNSNAYKDARKYFDKINSELDFEINKFTNTNDQDTQASTNPSNFNDTLGNALKHFEFTSDIQDFSPSDFLKILDTKLNSEHLLSESDVRTALSKTAQNIIGPLSFEFDTKNNDETLKQLVNAAKELGVCSSIIDNLTLSKNAPDALDKLTNSLLSVVDNIKSLKPKNQ